MGFKIGINVKDQTAIQEAVARSETLSFSDDGTHVYLDDRTLNIKECFKSLWWSIQVIDSQAYIEDECLSMFVKLYPEHEGISDHIHSTLWKLTKGQSDE